MFLALLVVWNAGIISGAEALSGFNNPATLIVGALFVIVTAIKESRLVARATTCIFGQTTTFNSGLARVLVCALSMSAFINTIPVLALLMPIAQDWGHTRGFDRKTIMMPLAFACSFGALLTTLGSATNLLIQELLYEAGKSDDNIVPFGVLDPGKIGLPLAVIGVGYLLLAAPRLLAIAPSGNGFGAGRVSGGETCSRDRSEDLFTEVGAPRAWMDTLVRCLKLHPASICWLAVLRTDSRLLPGNFLVEPEWQVGMSTLLLILTWLCSMHQQVSQQHPGYFLSTSVLIVHPCITCPNVKHKLKKKQVEVTGSSELVDKPFGPTLALLGLPADTLVKVRRRRSNPAVRSPLPQSRSRLDGGGLPLAVGVTTGIAGKNGLDLHEGDEESNGVGWGVIRTGGGSSSASMVTTSVAEGSPSIISGGGINSLSPALRHRSLYQRLATNGGAKMPAKKRLRDAAAAAPCIEMPSMRSTEGEIDHHCTDSRARGYPVGASSEIFSCAAVVGAAAEDHGGWFEDVHDVSPEDKVRGGDVLVLSCDQESMVRVQGSIVSHRRRGVNILGVSTHKLEAPGTVFLELVLSRFSDFLGRVARLDHEFFASRYGCSVVGFRLKGSTGGSGGGGRGSDVIGCWAAKQTNSNKKGCSIYKGDLKAARIPPGRKSCDGAPNAADGGVQDASLTMNGGESDFSTTVTGSPLDSTAPTPLMASPTQQRDEGSSSCNGSPVVRGVGLPVSETFQRGEGFAPGDTVLVLATEDLFDKMACVGEFLIKKRVGCLPEPVGWFQCFPLLIFAAMIAWVVLLDVSMVSEEK